MIMIKMIIMIIAVPFKHISNFWKTLDIPLINCEITLFMTWSEN